MGPLQAYAGGTGRLISLAAQVGRAGGDGVDVSYTSLFIALLWYGGEVSGWIKTCAERLGANLDAVYRGRGLTASDQERILAVAAQQGPIEGLTYSPSARRVLRSAQDIANEVERATPGAVEPRHILAVYLFRNPPDHAAQLEKEWAFDAAKWRGEFAGFLTASYAQEAGAWEPVLAPYLDPGLLENLPELIWKRYQFDQSARAAVTQWWERGESHANSRVLNSTHLFVTLNDAGAFNGGIGKPLPESGGNVDPLLNNPVILSAGSRHLLDGAESLAFTTTGAGEIAIRHLAAATLLVRDSEAYATLTSSGLRAAALRQRLHRDITRYYLDDDAAEWRKALIGESRPDLAQYQRDDPDQGQDQLDVRRFATAFALLIAAKDVRPPLSIGISGNWGSGKSFFMRLMRTETDRITAAAASDPRFHSNVVPILFNAWHYAEKDLLASLVQTIFQGLRGAMVAKIEPVSSAALSALEQARRERQLAESEAEAARQALEESRRAAEEKRRDMPSAEEQAKLSAAEVAREAAGGIRRALDALGLKDLIREGEDVTRQLQEAWKEVDAAGLRTRSTVGRLRRAPVRWGSVAAAGAIISLTAAAAYIFQDRIRAAIPAAVALLAEVGAAMRLVLGWARKYGDRYRQALEELDKLQTAVETRAAAKRAGAAQALTAAEAVKSQCAEAVAQADQRVLAARAREQEAASAVERTLSMNQLASLVNERLQSGAYEKYLGLVAAVRADFQRLSQLISDAAREAQAAQPAVRRVDRIVLYIDDLDRCPTDKVVLVLEAVHLLLAFELFVVVVGLDIRWASHSLEEKYQRQLSGSGATALDYLEKIFQVPFWLPPMDEQASRRLLAEMLPGGAPQTGKGGGEAGASGDGKGAHTNQGAAAGGRKTDAAEETAKEPETELLTIQKGERGFLLLLAPAVSRSPRRLKRFVNTYLLLRASLNPVERETFVLDGGARGTYREAMMLLAVLTSSPRAWARALDALTVPPVVETVADLKAITLKDCDPGEREYVEAAFDVYRSQAESPEDLRAMAPLVARFSFHYSLM